MRRLPYLTQWRTTSMCGLEVEFEHPQRVGHVLRRVGNGYQRHHHASHFLTWYSNPLLVIVIVAFDEVETVGFRQLAQLVVRQVDAVHLPGPGCAGSHW